MRKTLLFSAIFGLCLGSLSLSSCSQEDENIVATNVQKACAPAKKQVAAASPTLGVDTLIAQIVSDPDLQAEKVIIKCDNVTGNMELAFYRSADDEDPDF